ncbi:MAG: uracil-xanthine permease family protein [Treponema sp.]|jgi:uracil permease|nr:uracil-xanthine permease family protein [Treponema sp.]
MPLFERFDDQLSLSKKIVIGIQHTFTMFGATVLVPVLTGMDVSVALFMAGAGTLFFHLITKGAVPVFLGSSFAFIAPIIAVAEAHGMAYAQGGVVVAGLVYLLAAALVRCFGAQRVVSFFPPVVTGPIILIIGLTLAPTAVGSASENWLLAVISFLIVAGVSVFTRRFIQVLPVLCGLLGGYLAALIMGKVDFAPFAQAQWVGIPPFTLAKFNVDAVMTIGFVSIATMVEHIGDVAAIGATCDKNFMKNPGLHRTLLGDGLATSISAFFGGPANTTYSENTGVLALTRVYNPAVMRIAACFAILLGVIPKLGAFIRTIPNAVIGGISIVLFGMIASIGARTLVENRVDFKKPRNLLISAVILVLGLGGTKLPLTIGSVKLTVSSLALAAIAGIILNKALPAGDAGQ